MAIYEDDWHYGYAPREELEFISDAEHRVKHVDSRNVVGRFRDHEVIEGPASRESRKPVFKLRPLLETRAIRTAHGAGTDICGLDIRFDEEFADKSRSAVERFPSAWEAYQAKRKAPVTEGEREVLGTPEPVQKPKRPRKAKPAENVVPLKAASA